MFDEILNTSWHCLETDWIKSAGVLESNHSSANIILGRKSARLIQLAVHHEKDPFSFYIRNLF